MDVAIARGIEHRAQAARRDGRERDRLKLSGRGAIGTGAANALPTLVPIFEVPGARRRHADAGARGLVGEEPDPDAGQRQGAVPAVFDPRPRRTLAGPAAPPLPRQWDSFKITVKTR